MTTLLLVDPPGEQYKDSGWLWKLQFQQNPKPTTTMLKFLLTALLVYFVVAAADHHEHEHHAGMSWFDKLTFYTIFDHTHKSFKNRIRL
uniref:Putative secreted protein n=1 Tax=Ixodes ricinus TaxID=34613 RepID=A0A0K8RER5_IXORI